MSNTFRRIQHVSLTRPHGSADTTRAFYGHVLGLVEISPPTALAHLDIIWFRVGDNGDELHLIGEDAPINTGSGRHLCLEVSNVPELRARLVEQGHVPEDTTFIPGRPRFFCRDPFGNNIEFTTIEAAFQ